MNLKKTWQRPENMSNSFRREIGLAIILIFFFGSIFLWVLEEIDVLTPRTSFGGGDWPSTVLWFMGLILAAVLVPIIYISSYKNVCNGSRFWIAELAVIPPIVSWAVFLQVASDVCMSPLFLLLSSISILLVIFVHIVLLIKSHYVQCNLRYSIALWSTTVFYALFAAAIFHCKILWHFKHIARDILWIIFGH